MARVLNGVKSSDLIQGILAIGLGATVCVCVITGREFPTELFGAFMVILGYYFRTNNHNNK